MRKITKALGLVGSIVLMAGLCFSAEVAEIHPKINVSVGYRVDSFWPQKYSGVILGAVPGVAIDAQKNIWVFNRSAVPVHVYSPDGTLLNLWSAEHFKSPHHIRIDSWGNIWTADTELHVVRKFSSGGKLLLTLGTPGESGVDDRHFNQPTDMAIADSGDIFVSDGYGNNRIVHFDPRGQFVKTWGRLGIKQGEFSLPHAIAIDSKGNIYVADRNNARVQVFNQEGAFLAEWKNLMVPWGIWITPKDEIYICGSSPMWFGEHRFLSIPPKDQMIAKFDTEGRMHELWMFPKGEDGKEKDGELNWVHGIAVDEDGNLYVGDIKGKRVQKFLRIDGAESSKK